MTAKSNLLFSFHRRFLLRLKFGKRWRGTLADIAAKRGVHATPTYISHVIRGDWRSEEVERFIADSLHLPVGEVWPEYKADPSSKKLHDGQLSQGTA